MPKGESARQGSIPASAGGPGSVEYAVLCAPDDRAGVWAAVALRDRGLDVRVVTPHELVYSTSLCHTVSDRAVTASVRLADGTVFGPGLRGALNRLVTLPTEHLARASPADRAYAQQELHAIVISLVHGLPGVVAGRPDGRGLSGAWWSPAEWMVRGGRAGLRVRGFRTGAPAAPALGGVPLCVLLDRVVAPAGVVVPDLVGEACIRLGRAHGSGLLGLEFDVSGDHWCLTGGSPVPDVSRWGGAFADALEGALRPVRTPVGVPG